MNDENQDASRLNEILLGYLEAAEGGTPPDRQAFLAAHAEFAGEIADFLAGYHKVKRMAAPLRDSEVRRAGLPVKRSELENAGAAAAAGSTEPPVLGGGAAELGQLGDFRLLREIGRGGMGVVYEAEQISLRRRVALKILPFAGGIDARQLQRFRNEAEAAAHLHHSHIVPVFAVGCERGVHFYAMQFIDGQSLASLIGDRAGARTHPEPSSAAPPPPASAAAEAKTGATSSKGLAQTALMLSTEHSAHPNRFFRTVAGLAKNTAEALEYAHQMGVVHRDVKPANLLLDAHGHVWITDFGLAQFHSQVGLTMSGEVLGTLRYASPEQAMAKRSLVDHRTDIYSLGASLYELLTLRPVFDGKDRHALLHQIGFDEPLPPRKIDPSIPVELETIVLKALAKNPADRYGSAQELADDLQRFLDDKPILARRPSLVERTRKWGRRHPSVVAAAALLLMFGLIGFAVSTVVIAEEQSKTAAANAELASRNADLIKQEDLTKKAYQGAARDRDELKAQKLEADLMRRLAEENWARAEANLAQARHAVELVLQFSEGELKDNPREQDVRRRLLFIVLHCYEDLIDKHTDDSDLQTELAAGRERVAVILSALSKLRGNTLMTIVQDGNVQKDLQLAPRQIEQFAALMKETGNVAGGPGGKSPKGPKMFESAVAEKVIGEILSKEQMKRFGQIVLQVQQQGREGFSDPKIVDALNLSSKQRENIRQIQNYAHQAWSDHLFTDKKLSKNPAEFWIDIDDRIQKVLRPWQREKWQEMTGPPVLVELRDGFPFDGRNVHVTPGAGLAAFNSTAGAIAVMHYQADYTGSGFGHKVWIDDKQYYSWRGKEIPPTAFEIAVTTRELTKEERQQMKVDNSPDAARGWMVLFRSADPTVWNTDSPAEDRFAVPLERADRSIRYLRLKRMDTGEVIIIPIRYHELAQSPRMTGERGLVWNGACNDAFGGRHLGIAEDRPLRGPAPKESPRKEPPRKGPHH